MPYEYINNKQYAIMQKVIYCSAIAFMVCACGMLTNPDSPNNDGHGNQSHDTTIREQYARDARLLYMHEIAQDSSTHPNYTNPKLDTSGINEILDIIKAVHDLQIPERDTVFNVYDIHARYCYNFHAVNIKVDAGAPEIENLVNEEVPTGHAGLDSILTTYSFDSVKTYRSYPDFPWLSVYFSEEYNMIPIEKAFQDIASVINTEKTTASKTLCAGDGNTIKLTRNNGTATLTFSIGEGDCPAGCTYHKYWEFEVQNGHAEFIRTYEN